MLITLLKGRKKETQAPRRPVARTVASIVDISGPLPSQPTATPKPADARTGASDRLARAANAWTAARTELPYRESALVGASLRATTFRHEGPALSSLPREIDPFESDFPWIGWTEPRHESFVRSELRSPTFERDLKRVLAIFEN